MESLIILLPRLAPWGVVCFVALLVFCWAIVWRTGSTRGLRDVAAPLTVILKPWRRE